MAEATDEILMLSVRDGDRRNLGVLFDRHHTALYEFFYRMNGNAAVSEDLVQEVFVRILKYGATFRHESRFKTWMYRIARNVQHDDFGKRRNESGLGENYDPPSDGVHAPHSRLEQTQHVELLRRAFLMLPEDKRELLVLARYREMTHEEIGEILGADSSAVKVRVHRAMKELKAAFAKVSGKKKWNAKTSETTLLTT